MASQKEKQEDLDSCMGVGSSSTVRGEKIENTAEKRDLFGLGSDFDMFDCKITDCTSFHP